MKNERSNLDTLNNVTSAKSPLRIELSEQLFQILSDVLNEVHSSQFSLLFWKMLLTGHVNAVVSRKDLLEEKEHFRSPDLFSINGYSFPDRKQKAKKCLIRTIKHLKTRKNRKSVFKTIKNSEDLLIGFPESNALKKENLGVKLPEYHDIFIRFGIREKRKKVNGIANRFEDPYLKNVVKELPKILVEHFQNMYDGIPIIKPENKTFHVHLHKTILNEFIVAKYVEHGSAFYWYQHGSEYGEFKHDYSHHLSHDLADEFRTWGWKIKEKDIPWKAYRLESFRDEYQKYSNNKIYDVLICYPALDQRKLGDYKSFSGQLLSGLDKSKYPKLLARPRRSNKLHSHASQLRFIDDRRVDISTGLQPMMKEMTQCKLILQINVPSTNFLECLYVDHPTIGILRNDQPTDIVKPFYKFFLREGVLHENVESLVAHLNKIDIDDWWGSVMKKPEYNTYKKTFARKVE